MCRQLEGSSELWSGDESSRRPLQQRGILSLVSNVLQETRVGKRVLPEPIGRSELSGSFVKRQ